MNAQPPPRYPSHPLRASRDAMPVGEALTHALGRLESLVVAQPLPKTANGAGNFQAAKEGWLKAIASYPNLSGADCQVAIVIATHLNSRTYEAWPALARIAELTNREESTVWRSIERLSSLQLLAVRKGRGRKASNRYRPLLGGPDPKTLRRRNKNTASSQAKHCELAVRTLDEG